MEQRGRPGYFVSYRIAKPPKFQCVDLIVFLFDLIVQFAEHGVESPFPV